MKYVVQYSADDILEIDVKNIHDAGEVNEAALDSYHALTGDYDFVVAADCVMAVDRGDFYEL